MTDTDARLGAPLKKKLRATLGSETAPIVVVEFFSFKCAHCRTFHETVFPTLKQQYIDTGKVAWVAINASNNPRDQDSQVFLAARAALQVGVYWESLPALFDVAGKSDQEPLAAFTFLEAAQKAALQKALSDPATHAHVVEDFSDYAHLKVRGTPTFLVRKLSNTGRWSEGVIEDLQPLAYYREVFDSLLASP
ncbi:thioredoxin domain-containing protein [Oleiharenicola lentus]|uniref:thioredoxin domain-containing protein n=1 Tax=Oleiharenicola lentus TaxID=2508720 RepID=UPI003F666AEB